MCIFNISYVVKDIVSVCGYNVVATAVVRYRHTHRERQGERELNLRDRNPRSC